MSYMNMEHSFLMILDHTQRRTTFGRTPLDEWSTRRRDLYLTTHDIHNRQISMPPVGFEPKFSAGELVLWVAYATHSTLKPVPTLPRKRHVALTMWQIPDAIDTFVCAPDDGWRYHPKYVLQFSDINKLCKVASCWTYIGIYLRCTDP